jgi:hypothetical protein
LWYEIHPTPDSSRLPASSFAIPRPSGTMQEALQRMLPCQCTLLPHPQLHQGVQRVLQIRRFMLLGQEIEMLLLNLCSLGAGWQENVPLR